MKAETAAINAGMRTPRSGARTIIAEALKKKLNYIFNSWILTNMLIWFSSSKALTANVTVSRSSIFQLLLLEVSYMNVTGSAKGIKA